MSSGSVSGMIASLKSNKRTRISAFDKLKNFESGYHIEVHFDKKASSKQLHEIREKIKKENRKALLKKAIFGFFFLAISIYFIGFYKY